NNIPLFTVISIADSFPELSRAAEKLKAFAQMMNELSQMTQTAGLEELYDALLEKTGYARQLEQAHTEDSLNRLENVRELKSFIATHVRQTGDDSLAGFLDEVSLYTDLQNVDLDENTVTMMTIHSAKGLEFPTVFIAGMEEGIFPSLQAIGEQEQMEEERRLAYVAITRAKKRLYITSARQRMVFGQTAPHRVSRFVDEIPPEHIDRPYQPLKNSYFEFDDVPQADGWAQGGGSRQRAGQPPKKKTITPPRTQTNPIPDYKVGDHVVHNAFKSGVIKKMTPMGGDFLVEIEFENTGTKRLMLKAASRYMKKAE
ncbi:MAG: ATP-dependent helicase, partial [Oscillospiraceae bacterium]|nr:ATP-dependent helicase [Oscillospiraceae bacterium]